MGAQPRSTNAQNRENMGSFTQDLRWSTLELAMRTLALILLSCLLCSCYAQKPYSSPPPGQRCRGRNFDGSNNCKKFGAYYHEKDDCCERPTGGPGGRYPPKSEWGPWSEWRCVAPGTLQREQKCRKQQCSLSNGRVGTRNTQQRYSDTLCLKY